MKITTSLFLCGFMLSVGWYAYELNYGGIGQTSNLATLLIVSISLLAMIIACGKTMKNSQEEDVVLNIGMFFQIPILFTWFCMTIIALWSEREQFPDWVALWSMPFFICNMALYLLLAWLGKAKPVVVTV